MRQLITVLCLVMLSCSVQLQALEARSIQPLASFITSKKALSTAPKYIGPRHYFTYELWTDAKPWSYENRLVIRVIFKRRFPLEKAVREMVEEAVELHAIDQTAQAKLRQFVQAAFGADFASDDTVDFSWDPQRGMAIFRNGRMRGATADRAMAGWLLDFFCHEEEGGSALLEHKRVAAP